jgi:predicted choloylglycine hydrolase
MQEIPPAARFLADAARLRTGSRFHKEACELARLIDSDWRAIMLANILYDLALSLYGCSTMALPTPEGPVLARNMDWMPEDLLAQTSYLIRACEHGRLAHASAGWPGTIGVVSGLSGRGFAVVLNAVTCPEGVSKIGYPVLLHIRRVLEDAEDFDSAVTMCSEVHLAAPCLLTVVGTENHQRVVIERTPKRHAHRWGEDGQPLLATNHYRALYPPQATVIPELDETTCSRYDALAEFTADYGEDACVEDDALLTTLTDPTVIQDITAQHVIIKPRRREIRLFVPRRFLDPAGTG